MDISYYYHILDIGILYEKGRKHGRLWRLGERKRLWKEIEFWEKILEYIIAEEDGISCFEKLFDNLEKLCKKYSFPNYERIIMKKDEIKSSNCMFERNKEEEKRIHSFIKQLLADMKKSVDSYGGKERAYHILTILHNLPKAMHGQNILDSNCNVISYRDALNYVKGYMNEEMQGDYEKFFRDESERKEIKNSPY